jgi:hypothetical protein
MSAVLQIASTDITNPQSLQVDIQDIDGESTGRNQLGQLVRDRVAVKRKVSCKWGPLTDTQISTLLSAVSAVSFSLTYPDPMTGASRTGTFYVGDRSSPAYRKNSDNTILWESLSMNFVEV